MTPVEYNEEIARGIPNAKLEIFEHSGHSPPQDEPEKFARTVKDWLKEEGFPSLP